MSDSLPQTNPPHEPNAQAYLQMGTAVFASVFGQMSAADYRGSIDDTTSPVVADTLAHSIVGLYRSHYPNEGPLAATHMMMRDATGGRLYEVSLRDRYGTGLDLSVTNGLGVTITPVQSVTDGRQIPESKQEFRWHQEAHGTGYLEALVGKGENSQFVPYADPTIGNDGNGLGSGMNWSNPGGAGAGLPAVALAAESSPEKGTVRAVRDGSPVTLRDGYQQSGKILYNGFSVVEQSTGTGSVVYNKQELLGSSQSSQVLERAIETGASVDVRMQGGHMGLFARETPGQELVHGRL